MVSTHGDSQATDRCNVDFQFLPCAPPLPPDAEDSNATQLAACTTIAASSASQPSARRRLRTKTRLGATKAAPQPRSQLRLKKPPWFPKSVTLSSREQLCIQGFAAAFEKAAAMDFYITKYQGKAMQSLTPLFKSMTQGIHRLELQEAEEEKAAEDKTRSAPTDGESVSVEPARKKPKTKEDLAHRCRRLTIRLASMANRCFWLSAAELLIHVYADGDCLQSHKNITVFTKQLQWAMQQCKKILNKDIPEESREPEFLTVEAVSVHVRDLYYRG